LASSILKQLREDEREARKSLILEAVLKLFEQKPFDEIGMRDIAAEAGVSPAAIYRYFPSQDELFMEAFIKDLSSIKTVFQETLDEASQSAAPHEPLEEMAKGIVDHLIHNEATFQMMSYLMIKGNMPDYLLSRFQALQSAFIDKIIEVLKIAGIHDPDRTISHAFISSVMGVLMTFRNYPGKDISNAEEHIHLLVALIAKIFKKGV
jgi:AcrR family transcriptional regulator